MKTLEHKVHQDYLVRTLQNMGSIPEDPLMQRELLLYCISNSSEHMVSIATLKPILLKYSTYFSSKTDTEEVTAKKIACAILKFLFHGVEDVLLVKYMEEVQKQTSPNALYDLLDRAYREQMLIDGDAVPAAAAPALVSTENYKYADFIAASFPGADDIEAINRKNAIVAAQVKGVSVDPLMLIPYKEPFANFDPRNAIFKVNEETVRHYNKNFSDLGRSAAFLNPAGRYWERYVKIGARGNSNDAVDVVIQVLKGAATEADYRTFLGIIDVSKGADYFVREMIDAPTVGMGTHLGKPHHQPQHEGETTEYRILHAPKKMDGLLDLADPSHLYKTIRTGDPTGKGARSFSITGPLRPHNIHMVLQKKNGKFDESRTRVPDNWDANDAADEVTTFPTLHDNFTSEHNNNNNNTTSMGGILDLADPKNLWNTIRTGDPEGKGDAKFSITGPVRPGNIHKVLQKKDGKYKESREDVTRRAEAASDARIAEIMASAGKNAPLYEQHASASGSGLHHDASAEDSSDTASTTSSYEYGSMDSGPPGPPSRYNSYRSLPLGTAMGPSFIKALKPRAGALSDSDVHTMAHFHRRAKAHFGVEKVSWTHAELYALMQGMRVLAAMNVADRAAFFTEIMTAIHQARAEMLKVVESDVFSAMVHHKKVIFRRISEDDTTTELAVIPTDLNPLNFLHFAIETLPIPDVPKSHEYFLRKLFVALSKVLARGKSMALHKNAQLLRKIRNPGNALAKLVPVPMHPAFSDIDKVSADKASKFLYECIVLFCSWSPYAYAEFQKMAMKSVFASA